MNLTSVNPVSQNVNTGNYREPPPPYTPSSVVENQPSVIHQTIIVQAPLKDTPTYYICPRCQESVLTKVIYVSSKATHMFAGFLCGLTLWCLICCVAALPYYFHTFKNAQHYCPNCDELLGTYNKL